VWRDARDLPLGGRDLAPRRATLPPEASSCRRAPRRQGLNVVGYGGRILPLWGTTPDGRFLKIFDLTIYFRKS
jgi:hypothetical protein